jgi:DNA-binding NarL/FixJ family response regulator
VSALTRRLLIVEDERLVAFMLRDVLMRADFEVEVSHSAREAIELVDGFDPDGALIDVHLGTGVNGLQLGRRLSVTHPNLRLIFLSRFGVPDDARFDEGLPPASSFISKDLVDDPTHLVTIVEQALRDTRFREVIQSSAALPMSSLTTVQLEVLRLAATGLTNQAIAERQGTTVRNVEQRLARVYETLSIVLRGETNPRVEAIRQYIGAFGMPHSAAVLDPDDCL